YFVTIASEDTVIVTATTTLTDGGINTGTLEARGDVTVASTFDGGTAPLTFTGSSSSGLATQTFTLTGATGLYDADITINKSEGEVQLLSALVMDAASQDLTITEGTLNMLGQNLTVNGSSGTLILQDGSVLKLYGSETITANSGYPSLLASSTVRYIGDADGSADTYTIKQYTYQNLIVAFTDSTDTLTADNAANFDVDGNFILQTGIFVAPTSTMTIAKNFEKGSSATFTSNSGTVSLNGSDQIVYGSTTFNNLSKTVTAASVLRFQAGETTTVSGTWTADGDTGQYLQLHSTATSTQWLIDPQGTRTLDFIDVQDSNNTNSSCISVTGITWIDSGNNTKWGSSGCGAGGGGGGSNPPPPVVSDPFPAPAGGFSVYINSQAATTTSSNVNLTLNGGTASTMTLSNSFDFAGASLVPYQTTLSWNLCSPSCGFGNYTVYAIFYNSNGNSSPKVSDTIQYVAAPITPPTPTPPPTPPVPPAPPPPSPEPAPQPNPTPNPTSPEPTPTPGPGQQPLPSPSPLPGKSPSPPPSAGGGGAPAPAPIPASEPPTDGQRKTGLANALTQPLEDIARKTVGAIKEKFGEVGDFARRTLGIIVPENIPKEVAAGVSAVAIAPTAVAVQYSLASHGLLINIRNLSDLWIAILGALHSILVSLGLRRRPRYWGTVYDSVSKQPLDPVLVELVDEKSGKVAGTSITDLSGRFGFFDRPGKYLIRPKKTHYVFPSTIVSGKTDGVFANIYLGEVLTIAGGGEVISPNIPMDPKGFDWNQQAKLGIVKLHPRMELAMHWFLQTLFWAGFALALVVLIANPGILNFIFGGIYIALAIVRRFIPHSRLWGRVQSANIPVQGLYLELNPKAMPTFSFVKTVTGASGRFFLKAPKGEYILRVNRIEGEKVVNLKSLEVSISEQGVLNKEISLD
ncbi:MAG: hypothetical protein Q8R08_01235, partial [bacterium]|nr:hypothetical protein [bacterium]